jgi:hypothetical protein
MKRAAGLIIGLCILALAAPAMAANFAFHGDMNNRFLLYTNHNDWLVSDQKGKLSDKTVDDNFAEIKYRFWFEAEDDEGDVKGVFATEIGGLRFGESGKMPYSGDQVQMEVRWAYLDIQLPFVESPFRSRIGLQPFDVNPYLWNETAGSVNFYSDCGTTYYQLAWARGYEVNVVQDEDDRSDVDAFLARVNFKPDADLKIGLFGLYQYYDNGDTDAALSSRDWQVKLFQDKIGMSFFSIGVDGNYNFSNFFVNWDLIYQGGQLKDFAYTDFASGEGSNENEYDLSAYFLHADLGFKAGAHKFTYTFWYASGDDDPEDDEFEAFLSTDVDIDASIALFQGGYTDDDYFTEHPYILDKGFIMNKLAWDFKVTDKTTIGAAALYMMTAEEIEYVDNDGKKQANDEIGFEIDAYLKYMLYKNVEFAVNAGFLFAEDALDFFEVEQDGSADEDIFVSTARLRYKF